MVFAGLPVTGACVQQTLGAPSTCFFPTSLSSSPFAHLSLLHVPRGHTHALCLQSRLRPNQFTQKDEDATKASAYGSMAVAPVSTADAATPAPDAAGAAAAAAAAEKQLQADALAFARAARAKTRAASASAASASASTSAASSDTASASASVSASASASASAPDSAGSGSKAQYEMMENVFQALPGPDGDAARKVLKTKSTVTPEQYKRALGLLWQKRQRSVADAGAHLRDDAREIHLLTKTLNDKNATVAAKEDALDQMQILVMQIDNARDFVTLGGLDTCVALLQDHEDTIEHIALAPLAAWVIGTAAQNDNVVQDASAKAGAIEALLAILKRSEMFNVRPNCVCTHVVCECVRISTTRSPGCSPGCAS